MERLVSQRAHADQTEAYLAELLRAREAVVGAAPADVEARKQKILRGVLAEERSRDHRAAIFLRPAVAVSVLLVAGATLAATVGHSWITRRLSGEAAEAPRTMTSTSSRRAAPAAIAAEPEPGSAPTDEPAAASSARAPGPGRPAERARAAKGEDPARVVAALRALRSDHDPARAGRLLAEYLSVYPHGALAEEALALSIEAAVARHDGTAGVFAGRYLRAYPAGRFRRSAQQVLAQ